MKIKTNSPAKRPLRDVPDCGIVLIDGVYALVGKWADDKHRRLVSVVDGSIWSAPHDALVLYHPDATLDLGHPK